MDSLDSLDLNHRKKAFFDPSQVNYEQKTLPGTPGTPGTAFYNYPVGNKNVVEKELEKGVPTVPSVPMKFGFEPHLGNDDMYHCPKCPFCCFSKDDFDAHMERHRSDPNGVNEEGS